MSTPADDVIPAPTVGRIVHYVSRGSADGRYPSTCRAAIVTAVEGEQAALAVFNPEGLHFTLSDTPHALSAPLSGGTWHWPERAEAGPA
ncbi:hypothetical protein [Streptomyces sp. H27-C3]|uniref:hypothetical protein n=1 Tax=Streptomyces sp. H27-C3 TaxID=3046305 RepID=UPI0024B90AA8|nr:hypothetical protein [Streptomyces sp. H27-C3]MDJ0464989.1 hypothetical protein [Streptomyces sp. H27-C3]